MPEHPARAANPLMPLTVSNLRLVRGGRALLDDISFTLADNGVHVILGPNGAGKSLLLRVLHGLIPPDSGRIDWGGKSPQSAQPDLGMVLQQPVMLRRSVLSNLNFALARKGVPRRLRPELARQALERAELQDLAHQPAPRLSGGEAQRLAIIRAWVQRPRLLFFDEPCANLDPRSTHQVETLIREISQGGTQVILTTHDLAQARRLAGEVLFLANGRVQEHSQAERFFRAPQSAEAGAYLEGQLLV